MPLPLPEPVTRPAIEAKEYPFVWLYNVIIHAPGPAHEARVQVEVLPMAADGDLLWSAMDTIKSEEFMRAIAEVPEVAAAYQATLAAVLPMKAWVAKRAEQRAQEQANGQE